ncbi:Unknown protein [Striga hermonthica]|uniref:Uncharacterized protein n=1 Tax=Striga hermonthica TaxID=68872 RepID=A0A9N7RSB4_STRHE|nr:Unknown protein [Striga hermonthica]
MQRQSLGSPSSKDEKLSFEAQKQSPSQSSSLSSSDSPYVDRDDDEAAKKKKKKATAAIGAAGVDKHQSYIHLIPMLTLICFLILYLASHDPSQNDLAQFNFPGTVSNAGELQLIKEINKGEIMAIQRLKILETTELGTAKQRLLHRKIAHF